MRLIRKIRKSFALILTAAAAAGMLGCESQNTDGERLDSPQRVTPEATPEATQKPEESYMEITVTDQIKEGRIWVLADNEKNRGSSLWGEPTVSEEESKDGQTVKVNIPADTDIYIVRMIDADELYYDATGIAISEGQSVVLKESDDGMDAFVEVYSADGTLENKYEMFVAAL